MIRLCVPVSEIIIKTNKLSLILLYVFLLANPLLRKINLNIGTNLDIISIRVNRIGISL